MTEPLCFLFLRSSFLQNIWFLLTSGCWQSSNLTLWSELFQSVQNMFGMQEKKKSILVHGYKKFLRNRKLSYQNKIYLSVAKLIVLFKTKKQAVRIRYATKILTLVERMFIKTIKIQSKKIYTNIKVYIPSSF